MRLSIRVKVLLAGACMIAGPIAWGQGAQDSAKPTRSSLEVALVYNPLMSNLVAAAAFGCRAAASRSTASSGAGWV